MTFDLKRHCLAITIAHCQRRGISIKPPACEPPLTPEELEAARQELFMADLLVGPDPDMDDYRQQDREADERIRDITRPPWER